MRNETLATYVGRVEDSEIVDDLVTATLRLLYRAA
jgi:hypothetical protein